MLRFREWGNVLWWFKVPVPLLFCSCSISPSPDPGDFTTEGVAKVTGGFVHGELVDRCPKFQLIAVTLALVAIVSSAV